jgi:outer membrane receptor protein involved in Fe transport
MTSKVHPPRRRNPVPLAALLIAGAGACGPIWAAGLSAAPTAAAGGSDNLQEIVVTAQKRRQLLAKVPESITAFTSQALHDFHIKSFDDYAAMTPNLSFSYGGGPTGFADSRTVAIRGITGQNLFGTSGATGFYIDDTPLPSSVDPRIVDIANIQVLKGPQGTLYGESSLGGNIKLVTRQPDLKRRTLHFTAHGGATSGGGSPDEGGSAIINLPIVRNTLGVRIVAFANHDAGYLTRTYPTNPASPGVTDPFLSVPRTSVGNQGAVTTYGGSVTALWAVTSRFNATLRIMAQEQNDHGFPATFAPLPALPPFTRSIAPSTYNRRRATGGRRRHWS